MKFVWWYKNDGFKWIATINDHIYYSRIISMNDGENYKGKTLLFAFYDDYPPYYNHDYEFTIHICFKFIDCQ